MTLIMNSLVIVITSIIVFVGAYKFYGTKIASLWGIDSNRQTPAHARTDGVDYIPSKNWLVLFGHHFASIAGAGPIIGPVIAVTLWGWFPALLWVVLGSIFLGGIHDFGSLMVSVREEGQTIGQISSTAISKKARVILSIFLWLALILVIAVFAYLGAKTFTSQPEIVLPSLGILPISVLVGLALYQLRWNPTLVTLTGLLAIGGLIIAGKNFPIVLSAENSQTLWIIVLFIYCFIASITPVNYLLQPRDYLSSFLLVGGLILAIGGIFISKPTMNAPAYTGNLSDIGYLWPMMFITIACGANSGFHSLIASGTTSKQLSNECHAQRIGFGAMLTEGFLATIVVVLIAGGFSITEFNFHVVEKTNPVNLYGLGFGNVTAPILGDWGNFIALTILNAFILTTLDSATRITRYITEELFNIKNRYGSTLIIVLLGAWLAMGKDSANNPLWMKIWPAFGASNQLVAALALLVISCWLLRKGKPTLYSLIPAVFMLTTSLAALGFQIVKYIENREIVLIIVSLTLIGSALYLAKEVCLTFKNEKRTT